MCLHSLHYVLTSIRHLIRFQTSQSSGLFHIFYVASSKSRPFSVYYVEFVSASNDSKIISLNFFNDWGNIVWFCKRWLEYPGVNPDWIYFLNWLLLQPIMKIFEMGIYEAFYLELFNFWVMVIFEMCISWMICVLRLLLQTIKIISTYTEYFKNTFTDFGADASLQ